MKHPSRLYLLGLFLAAVCGCTTTLSPLLPLPGVLMPSGTMLKVLLGDALGTDKSTPGDHFSGSLAEAIVIDGKVLFPKAAKVRGRVYDVREPRRMNGGAMLHLLLTEISWDQKAIAITTNHFVVTGERGVAGATGDDIYLPANSQIDFVLAMQVQR